MIMTFSRKILTLSEWSTTWLVVFYGLARHELCFIIYLRLNIFVGVAFLQEVASISKCGGVFLNFSAINKAVQQLPILAVDMGHIGCKVMTWVYGCRD